MNVERQIELLNNLQSTFRKYGKQGVKMLVTGYLDFYYDELSDLAAVFPEYVEYHNPQTGTTMYPSDKHYILPAILEWEYNEVTTPVAPQVEAVASNAGVPVTDSANYHITEKFGLFYIVAPDKRVLTTGYADIKILGVICELLNKETTALKKQAENDAAYMTSLEQRNSKLEADVEKYSRMAINTTEHNVKLSGDLEAAQAIIVQAGKDFEALKAENAQMKALLIAIHNLAVGDYVSHRIEKITEMAKRGFDIATAYETTLTPAQEAPKLSLPLPKFTVGQAVWVVFNYGREFGLSNKAATIIEIKQEDGANWYRVRYEISQEEGTQFWEEYTILPREETI